MVFLCYTYAPLNCLHTSLLSCLTQVRVSELNGQQCTSRKIGSHAGRAHKLSVLPDNPSVRACCERYQFFDLQAGSVLVHVEFFFLCYVPAVMCVFCALTFCLQSNFLSTGEDGVVMLFDIRTKGGPLSKLCISAGRRQPVSELQM